MHPSSFFKGKAADGAHGSPKVVVCVAPRIGRVIVRGAGGGFRNGGVLRISILISNNGTKANFPC